MNKNLIYFCIFYNKGYIDLFKYLLISLKLFSKTDTFDIVVYTSSEFEVLIQELSNTFFLNIKIKTFPYTTIYEACCARFYIFDYEEIDKYSKILYLDTDILINNDISRIFDIALLDKIYGLEERTIEYHSHGGSLFDFSKIDRSTPGMNSGILLFQNTDSIKSLFKRILVHSVEHSDVPKIYTDQALLNYYAISDGICDSTTIQKYAVLQHEYIEFTELPTVALYHFFGKVGNSENKEIQIIQHLKNLINLYITKPSYSSDILYSKQYTWNGGRIVFEARNKIITSWVRGNYKWLDTYILEATWAGISHIILMNSDYSMHTSIRVNDLIIVTGRLDTFLKISAPLVTYKDSVIQGNKYLIYFCVFNRPGYFDLLRLLLSSCKLFSNLDSIDFLVYTSKDYESIIKKIADDMHIVIHLQFYNHNELYDACCSRYNIFEYKYIDQYSKILYLDTDIIIRNDISKLFAVTIEDLLYGLEEDAIKNESHGSWFFDFTKINKEILGINSGILLFQNSERIKLLFNTIQKHIQIIKSTSTLFPKVFLDQAILNYHIIKDNLYNSKLLTKFAILSKFKDPPYPSSYTDLTFCHFVWPMGNTQNKYNRMIEYYKHILSNYRTLYLSIPTSIPNAIMNNKYSWNNGQIEFKPTMLVTSWGKGIYKIIDPYTFELSWNGFSHIVKMNTLYNSYISIRKNDCDFTSGQHIFNYSTYTTKYGLITLYNNEMYIGRDFKDNSYWDEDTLLKLKKYINPDKNILEIGAHCGTSSIVYASYLNSGKCYVYEPQKNMYLLLVKNINQNNLHNKIISFNKGVFCFNGKGYMNDITLDGGDCIVSKRYNEESNLDCNFGGLSLGTNGELIELTTIDLMDHDNIGFIHCDAQGSENFIFSSGIELIKKYKPYILYENNEVYAKYLYNNVCAKYPSYQKESKFNIKDYCINTLGYSTFIDNFNGGIDTLLIP